MADLELSIYSPERILLQEKKVAEVTLTGSEGRIQILPDHVRMVGTNEPGLFSFKDETGEKSGFISNGFFEVNGNQVSVMAEVLELAEEIDLKRAKEAQKKAEEALAKNQDVTEDYLTKYRRKLHRATLRQEIGKK